MKSELFQIPIASELVNVVNFIVVDLLIISFVMEVTGIIAGHINHHSLRNDSRLKLDPFHLPLIGGGLITFRGRHRNILIMVRISVLLAAIASTFGVEGRTELPIVERSAMIRRPGFQQPSNEDTMERMQRGFSCGTWEEDVFYFGTMADDECYPNTPQYSSIRSVSRVRGAEGEAHNCTASYFCTGNQPISTYRCAKADIICQGVPLESGCANAKGIETDVDKKEKCNAILFTDDGEHVIGCSSGVLRPNSSQTLGNCWKFNMNPEDAQWWNETYPRLTLFNARAVYASANGIEERRTVELPGNARPVTIVTLWWIVSVGWLVLVSVILACAWVVFKSKTPQARLHTAKSLVQILETPVFFLD
ncbi:hypothetical protein BWQ96_04882 [Gracilariopsis chorda]|uniref:Uncharacterized protein n=1 Tax=Gracilariopsis chorda TaxID=448386 RepID=A0A2V3ITD6_9FLOR|nr:hypothetical protein BWQ96_04882 [Gracilariopsis chorda]|eukprot:PXF45362.1 hypothetical protein BWQ96_04882 [Gracilariopsis chorda]